MTSKGWLYGLLAGTVLEIGFLGMLVLGDLRSQVPVFFVFFAVASGAFLLGVRWRRGLPFWAILAFGMAFRLTLLFLVPSLSDDIYRYAWDGRMQFSGINPYLHAPSDPAIAHLRDDVIYPRINHAELPTIYPPLAQVFFLLGYALTRSIWGIKLLVVCADVLIGWLLVHLIRSRRGDVRDVVIYLWHPLVVLEGAGSGHLDLLGIAALVLGLFWWSRKRYLGAMGALGGAVLVKFLPVAFLPGFMRPGRALGALQSVGFAVFLGVILVGYTPYAVSGVPFWGSLGIYITQWEFNGLVFRSLRGLLGSGEWARATIGAGFGAFMLALAWGRTSALRTCYLGIGAFLVLTPTLHPWYALWVVPFLVFTRSTAWMAFSLLIVLSYHVLILYAAEGVWMESDWIPAIEFGIPLCLLLWAHFGRRRSVWD